MALTVGTDTYITVAEADAAIAQYHTTTDPVRIAWEALAEADKEVLLRRGLDIIEQTPIVGFKISTAQTLQFPRMIFSTLGWAEQADVPAEIKRAQAELAGGVAVGKSKRAEMQAQGVTSVTVGSASETYSGKIVSEIAAWSEDAARILAGYMTGAVEVV